MATRSGSVDPGMLLWLIRHAGIAPDALEHGSGARVGAARALGHLRRHARGDRRLGHGRASAHRARRLPHRLRAGIAAMAAAMDGLDALVFTGGVGEHAPLVRAEACAGLGFLGVQADEAANVADGRGDREIAARPERSCGCWWWRAARTWRSRARCAVSAPRPRRYSCQAQSRTVGHVVAGLPRVGAVAQSARPPSAWRRSAARGAEAGHAVDHVHHEMEAVQVVEHHHVERRGGGALLLVAAHVEVVVVGAPVGEAVDQPGVAVVGEDDRAVAR